MGNWQEGFRFCDPFLGNGRCKISKRCEGPAIDPIFRFSKFYPAATRSVSAFLSQPATRSSAANRPLRVLVPSCELPRAHRWRSARSAKIVGRLVPKSAILESFSSALADLGTSRPTRKTTILSEQIDDDLPVSECLSEIVAAVTASTAVVLKAPPGAGKTTGVPPALLSAGVADQGQILLIQPRRLAARSAAGRLAYLVGSRLGDRVGYQVRFDRRTSANTRLVAMTTGVALRKLQSDPLLEKVACVLLDEFHERSLEMDLLLGMLQRIRTTLRPDLKLVVMSATLDPQPIVDFLEDARPIIAEGRAYPVDVRYAPHRQNDPIDQQVSTAVSTLLSETAGHLLVFLPGVGEIRRTHRTLRHDLDGDFEILELYGDLSPQEQDAVLKESPDLQRTRKIVLATNIAETSITIPGVTGVIDSGLARVMRFDSNVGLPKLSLESISQASADQRAGRAGRTEPGICYRLWPANTHRSRAPRDSPEIVRADFAGAALALSAWGERHMFDFPWLTAPPEAAVNRATDLLTKLHAVDQNLSVTKIGRRMLSLPVHPRLARFLLEAADWRVAEEAAVAAALLTERNPFRSGSPHRQPTSPHRCDVSAKVDRLKSFFDGESSPEIEPAAARRIRKVADQLLRSVESIESSSANHGQGDPVETRLARALLSAYPDRLAKSRDGDGDRGRMVGGRGVRLDRRSHVRSELFLCIDVDSGGTEALVRMASAVQPQWLDPDRIHVLDQPLFHPASESVVARRRRCFDDLLLGETPIKCEPSQQVAEILADAARENMSKVFPDGDEETKSFLVRARLIAQQMTELELPPPDDDLIDRVLLTLCRHSTSFPQLRAAPWLDQLRGMYDYNQLQAIDRHAPTRIQVPSGNSIRIHYSDKKPPFAEVRIQEIFGWKENPHIAGGRLPVQLHLLGPNYRAQQITEDLANFWRSTYLQVRKDLRRRYPKHHWPEDPTAAVATRNGLKPKSS